MDRRAFVSLFTLLPFLKPTAALARFSGFNLELPYTEKMPVFFVGHQDFGKSPKSSPFSDSLRAMGSSVKPAAILVISAHSLSWGETYVYKNSLYTTPEYKCVGSPETAKSIANSVGAIGREKDLDHGAWSVLRHISPGANIPVLEMSIDITKPLDHQYHVARQISYLRRRGVLIIGSGNIVHNLELTALKFWTKKPYDWALEFDAWVRGRIEDRDLMSLFQYHRLGKVAEYAVPTADHYIPMLYVLSLCNENEQIDYTYEEVTRGVSFTCFKVS